jgi:hypothetical protein
MSASSAMRSLMRTRAALPRAAAGRKQALSPIFSMQARYMSIPRPSWDKDLKDLDPEVYKIIQMEQQRQHKGIALIPSENYTTHAVSQVSSGPVPGVFSLRAVFCGAFPVLILPAPSHVSPLCASRGFPCGPSSAGAGFSDDE